MMAAISVDLDEVHHYARIHGIELPPAPKHLVYERALGRAGSLAEDCQIPLTFFAVGQDLWRPQNAEALREICRSGHRAENHSLYHRYDLTRRTPAEMRADVEGGALAIADAVGRAPRGFRAPGYTVSDELFNVLEELGVAFDSSVLSSPPYYAAKATTLAAMAVIGRYSASIVDHPRVLTAPRNPYRPGRPYTRTGHRKLVELPILVSPSLGFPLIGTTLLGLGPRGCRAMLWSSRAVPLLNIELHGMDFLDQSDGLGELSRIPELSRPLSDRMRTLRDLIGEVRRQGRRFVTLAEAADTLLGL